MMSTEKNLKHIVDLMQRDDSIDAPADSIRWASNLFKTRAAEPKKTFVQKLTAVLMMEIAPDRPAFGERSASASHVRQLAFRAGDNAIDLRIEPGEKTFSIRGQVLGDGFAEAAVRLFNDTRHLETRANELSEFSIDAIMPGEYELLIHGEGLEISLKSIDIE